MSVEYREAAGALDVDSFLTLAGRLRPDDYDRDRVATSLARTINISAWEDGHLVGVVRVLSDGYFFSTVTEIMVDPSHQRRGIGVELMRRAIAATPAGRLYLAAQPGTEAFFERAGFRRGPVGYVGRPDGHILG
jgi:ribosomal protein S18 acetylase RimI-like enzyme